MQNSVFGLVLATEVFQNQGALGPRHWEPLTGAKTELKTGLYRNYRDLIFAVLCPKRCTETCKSGPTSLGQIWVDLGQF